MKIKKMLIPAIGLTGLSSVVMPIVLSSCNNENIIAVPIEQMKFGYDKTYGKYFEGLVEGTDLSKYNTLVLPDDVEWTKKYCFADLTKENNSNIKTIIFNKNLKKMGADSFKGNDPVTVEKLDFSQCEKVHKIPDADFSKYTFSGLSHEHLGKIVSNTSKISHDDFVTLCLSKGVPGEWLLPSEWTTTKWKHKLGHLWETRFQPLEFGEPKSSAQAIEAYADAVKNVPSIFIDDFLNAYSNYIPLDDGISSLEETVNNVSVLSDKDGNILGSFDLTFIANKEENGATAYNINVEYRNIPLIMVTPSIFEQDESTCALVFDKSKMDEKLWLDGTSITFDGKVDDQPIDKEIVDSTTSFSNFKARQSDNLFNILYNFVEIPSGYFRNLVISDEK